MIKVAEFYDSFYKWAGPEAVLDWPKKKILAAMPQENPKGRRNDSQWCFGNISLTPRKESEGNGRSSCSAARCSNPSTRSRGGRMSIKAILSQLSRDDSELLSYAMETRLTNQFVEYRPNRWVGVNILPNLMPHLVVEQTAGMYSAGTIVRDVANCNGAE